MWSPQRSTIGILILLLFGMVVWGRSTDAQQAQSESRWLVFARSRVQFGIHSGRVVFTMLLPRGFVSPWSTDQLGGKEQIAIVHSSETGASEFTYRQLSPKRKLTITAKANGRLAIRQEPGDRGKTVPSEFLQEPSQPLVLTFGKDAEKKTLTAPTLWHLLLEHPDPCKQYVLPDLERLRPDWKLLDQAQAVEKALLAAARLGKLPDRQHWAALVAQLADERFTRREAADRQLRAIGRQVLPYLRDLDREKLDVEQQYRIHRIVESLSDTLTDETPRQTANSMLGDPTIWIVLLGRDSQSTREVAAKYLERLLESPIDFDPAADAPTRRRQIEALRKRIAGQ
ncbi:MAG: hypothetical protein JW888_07750 [Pirellulales bacterium]|nr:hypothetical protein [Pirellulales bacterium]